MQHAPKIGDLVPKFDALDGLIGHSFVLYFYPKDDTPGCTKEACELRDVQSELSQLKTLVIGVSPDTTASHDKFKNKYHLNFKLVSDPSNEICRLFGVWEEKNVFGKKTWGVIRTTFVVDAKGIIRWIEKPVQVEGHAQRVLQALQNITKSR